MLYLLHSCHPRSQRTTGGIHTSKLHTNKYTPSAAVRCGVIVMVMRTGKLRERDGRENERRCCHGRQVAREGCNSAKKSRFNTFSTRAMNGVRLTISRMKSNCLVALRVQPKVVNHCPTKSKICHQDKCARICEASRRKKRWKERDIVNIIDTYSRYICAASDDQSRFLSACE